MDKRNSVTDGASQSSPIGDTAKSSNRVMYGHVWADDYREACRKANDKAIQTGGKTIINFAPLQNGVILKGTSLIKKSAVLKPDPKSIMEEAEGFEFEVVAIGPDVKNIEIGDVIDIKSTHGLSLRPMIPHPHNVTVWRKKLKADRDSMIRHTINSAEDAGKVGSAKAVEAMGIVDKKGGIIQPKVDLEENIEIVEHFATEDHNVSAAYIAIDYVREG